MVKKAAVKRRYPSREERRLALLDVAAEVVEDKGWSALSMLSLAEAAQVSRQLVYQHFSSVDELMAGTLEHLFRHQYEAMRRAIGDSALSLEALLRFSEKVTFDEPPRRIRALWQMLTMIESDREELATISRRVRRLVVRLWAPVIEQHMGVSETQARALAWMLNMAFWGAHQLSDEGELSRKAAIELCTKLVTDLVRAHAREDAAPAPPTKP